MIAEFFTIVEATTKGVELYEASKKVQSKVKMLLRWLKDGAKTVVILGSGGVGKTTLAEYLTDSPNFTNTAYNESPDVEKVKIGKNIIGEYWVAPGQADRIERYWDEVYRKISDGKVQTIINVVAYGFHSVSEKLPYTELKDYYKGGMSKEQFLVAYLESRRAEEIRIVHEIKHRIKDTSSKIDMITLVTKQDLWWKERNFVRDYYVSGAYNEAITEIADHKGKANFEHTYISVSLLANNFAIGNEPFQLVAEGYDENIRIANMNAFINQIESYLK